MGVLENLDALSAAVSADELKRLVLEAQENRRSTRASHPLGVDSGISYTFEMHTIGKGCLPQKGEAYAAVPNPDGTMRKIWSITYFAALGQETMHETELSGSDADELLIAFSNALQAHLVPRFDGRDTETYELGDNYGCVNMHEPSDDFRHFSGELMVNHYGKGKMVSVRYVGGLL
jgi:hypothetical protein